MPVKLLLGDPDSEAVAIRASEVGIAVATQIRTVLQFLNPITNYPGIEIRLDNTPLYYALYAFDDAMIVSQQIIFLLAHEAPHLYLPRAQAESVFDTYRENFELLWSLGQPIETHPPIS